MNAVERYLCDVMMLAIKFYKCIFCGGFVFAND